jgi:glutamate 5-kinase
MAYADGFAKAEVVINKGARAALTGPKARSLLLAGVISLNDDFKKGDLLRIKDENGQLLGIGRAQYDRAVAQRHLNDERYRPLIHYDYLFIYPNVS